MVRLWVHIENNRVVRVAIMFDNTRIGRLQMLIGEGLFRVQAFYGPDYMGSDDDSGHEDSCLASNPISEGSSDDSGHEDSSVSNNPNLQMGELSASDSDQETPRDDDPFHGGSGASGFQSLPVEDPTGSDDYQGNPLGLFPAPAYPSLSESPGESDYQQCSAGPVPKTPETSGANVSIRLTTSEELSISDDQQTPADPVSGTPETSPDETNIFHSLSNIPGSDHPTMLKPLDLDDFTPYEQNIMTSSLNRRNNLLRGLMRSVDSPEAFQDKTNVSHSSINIPRTEPLGEATGMNIDVREFNQGDDNSERKKQRKIDEARNEKTGCDFENLVLIAETAALKGSSRGTVNVLNAGDDPGGSAVTAEKGNPEVPSVDNMDREDVDNMKLLEGLLDHYAENNDFPPAPDSTNPQDYERAVSFLISWMKIGGSPASLRHSEVFELCKKIWFFP